MKIFDSLAHIDSRRRNEQHHGSLNFVCVRSTLLLLDRSREGLSDFGKISIPELNTFIGKYLRRQLQRPDAGDTRVERIKFLWTVTSQAPANIHHQITSCL